LLCTINLHADEAVTPKTDDTAVTKTDDSKQIEDKQIETAEANVLSDIFTEDRISFEIMTGSLFSTNSIGPDIQTFDYAPLDLRVGWMLTSPEGEGFFRGNLEALLELSSNFIYNGPGNIFFGPTAFLRYNFVQPDWCVVPYVQLGAGIVYTDAYHDQTQQAIGQGIEFTPQASIGLKYLLNDNWSLNVEGMYHHVSNAGMADRNLGVNSLGFLVGATYYFDKLWKE
jgi:hypothetical protein